MRRCAACARELDPEVALIGFCGAPWTVATYMVAGQGTPDQAPARMLAYRHPEAFASIIDILVENSIEYLLGQLKAGADALQIFDTWAGVLPPREFERWSIAPTRRIVEGVRSSAPGAKIIGFPRGAGARLPDYVDATAVDAVSIDWTASPALIRERVQNRVAVQGNLDPLALIAGGAALDAAVDEVLANYAQGRLIFNLGHGIQPETPIAHVEQMLKRVRAYEDESSRGTKRHHPRKRMIQLLATVVGLSPQRNVTWIPAGAVIGAADSDDLVRGYDGIEQLDPPSHRPAALDDGGRTLREQIEPDRPAEFARPVRWPGTRGLDEHAAGMVEHRGRQRHLRARDRGKCRDRRIAMAVEDPQHLALGIAAPVRGCVVDAGEQMPRLPVVGRAFDRDNALPGRRQHFPNRKFVGDAIRQPDALQSRSRHDQRVRRTDLAAIRQPLHFRTVELANAGVGSAAIVNDLDFGKQPARIGRAPDRVGADLESLPRARLKSSIESPARNTSTSAAGSRASIAPITSPGVSSLPGMSLSECIAACSLPDRDRWRISATKAPPLPPCIKQLAGLVGVARPSRT